MAKEKRSDGRYNEFLRMTAVTACVLFLTVSILGAVMPGAALVTAGEACAERIPHPPIGIAEEHGPLGFTMDDPITGESMYRTGSGVVAGDGSEEDPFIIAGWCLASPPSGLFLGDQVPGVLIEGTESHVIVRDNAVLGTGLFDHGVEIAGATNVAVDDNMVAGALIGIRVDGSAGVAIRDNTVIAGPNGETGIRITTSDGSLVQGNTITGHGQMGIHLAVSDDVLVEGNTATAAGLDGIFLYLSHGSVVGDNSVNGNGRFGILLSNSDAVTARGNTIDQNAHGLRVSDADGAMVDANTVTANAGNGILVQLSSDAVVHNNTVDGNGQGIGVTRTDRAVVQDNLVTANDGAGITGQRAEEARVENNTVTDNAAYGVFLTGSDLVLRDNTASRNLVGFLLSYTIGSQSDRATVQYNTATDNEEDGIRLVGLNGVLAEHNVVEGNAVGVFATMGARNVVLQMNNIQDNDDGIGLNVTDNQVDARENWWGCTGGPDHDDCNSVQGPSMYDPWRSEPVPNAGAE